MIDLDELEEVMHSIRRVEPTPISIRLDLDENIYFYQKNGKQFLPDQRVMDYLATLYNAAPELIQRIRELEKALKTIQQLSDDTEKRLPVPFVLRVRELTRRALESEK